MIVRNILASVGVLIAYLLMLPLCYVAFDVRFHDDIEFVHGRRSAKKLFHFPERYKSMKKLLFLDIRKDVPIGYYTQFWVFLVSSVLLVSAAIANLWLKAEWTLFAVRASTICALLSWGPALFSRRFTLYRGNRIRNRKEYAEKVRGKLKKQIENRSAPTVILNAVGIPALSVLFTVLLWYAKLFVGR